MKKSAAAVAAAVAVLALSALSGVALAGDHQGDHGNQSTSESAQAGVKPDNTTDHNTSCTTGGGSGASATCHSNSSSQSDASKRYGNGKTAAQIANGNGAPSGTAITGPGNSQPHKVCGRDVHAVKSYGANGCASTKARVKVEVKGEETEHSNAKVFICHATGSATNPYVLIHVSVNAEAAHMRHQGGRDVVLGANAGACPSGHRSVMTTTTTTAATTVQTTTTTAAVAPTTTATVPATVATTTTAAAVPPATTTTAAAAAPTTTAASGVLGATKALKAPSTAAPHASGGVLGTAKTLGRTATSGTLPFTGLPLWIVELVALGLIGGGVVLRLLARRSGAN